MFKLLPKKDSQAEFANTELLATHKPFYQQYALFIILLILIILVGIIAFGGIIYKTGNEFILSFNKNNQEQLTNSKVIKKNDNYSTLNLETGYSLKKDNEWELVTIANEPNRVEIIASSAFNATRIEISSYTKTFPNWEESIGLVYFDVTDEDEKTIQEKSVLVQKGRDGSLYAKSGKWEDDDKVMEIRVFSVSKESTDKIFDLLAKSVKDTTESAVDEELMDTEESTESTQSNE